MRVGKTASRFASGALLAAIFTNTAPPSPGLAALLLAAAVVVCLVPHPPEHATRRHLLLAGMLVVYATGALPASSSMESASRATGLWRLQGEIVEVAPSTDPTRRRFVLRDSAGREIGVMLLVHDASLAAAADLEARMALFAARASAELERSIDRPHDALIREGTRVNVPGDARGQESSSSSSRVGTREGA